MRERGGLVLAFGLASLTCDGGTGSNEAGGANCGDGVLDADEACDDGNTADGDGCSSTCETEYPQPTCVTLLETPDALQATVLVTPDGRVLVTGVITRSDGTPHGWVGAFDTQGNSLWELDFPDMQGAGAIAQTETGFAVATFAVPESSIVYTDDAGNVLNTYIMPSADPNAGWIGAMLDTSTGLLLGGMRDSDLWLAELGDDGQLSTLFSEDYAGLPDHITHLRRSNDIIAAVASVPVANHSIGDQIRFDVYDTLLLEFDEQGTEQRRTLLSSGDDMISIAVNGLELGPDETWVLAGYKEGDNSSPPGKLGWASAVRNGEVLWTFEMPASVAPVYDLPTAGFLTAAMSTDIMLAGSAASADGVHRWAVRLDGQTGELLDEIIGAPSKLVPDTYWGGSALGDRALLVGHTRTQAGLEQWLCDAPI